MGESRHRRKTRALDASAQKVNYHADSSVLPNLKSIELRGVRGVARRNWRHKVQLRERPTRAGARWRAAGVGVCGGGGAGADVCMRGGHVYAGRKNWACAWLEDVCVVRGCLWKSTTGCRSV